MQNLKNNKQSRNYKYIEYIFKLRSAHSEYKLPQGIKLI